MSAGSGEVKPPDEEIQELTCARGATKATGSEAVTWGSEQQLHEWQFGGHCPPERSVGHGSSHCSSPQSAASPLTLNVSSARKTIITARRTRRVSHNIRAFATQHR